MTKNLTTIVLAALIATSAAASDYTIGIDDVLDIAVWNLPELQKTVPVRPDGKISLPLVNDVVAAGLTPMELRARLTEKIAEFVQSPDVSVVVREIRSLKVSVLGQVREPGRYDLKGPSTVFDALAMAGGLTEFAARRKITILRTTSTTVERLHFDYDAAVDRPATANGSLTIQPGDVVVVP
ncbi:MAG TPA: polysaccharide biosynthesis/export family protein [Thermoanaerobaculia bacterium]|nr:polysaccharide biosynthesis/export family protein [Thermoanaerobaculia bacterium]